MKVPVLILTGPTAVGKTELSLDLAERLQGEIISADSAQVYRGLDVGTAKIGRAERLRVDHHLIDIMEPNMRFSVALFQHLAWEATSAILARGKLPIVVGGTGLFIEAYLASERYGGLPANPALRLEFKEKLARLGQELLWQKLCKISPERMLKISPADHYRMLRVYEALQSDVKIPPAAPRVLDATIIFLDRPREELYARIEIRTELMLKGGLMEETQRCLSEGFSSQSPGLLTLGYKETVLYHKGLLTTNELQRLIARNTRHYAKRQWTWWRKKEVHRFDARQVNLAPRIADLL